MHRTQGSASSVGTASSAAANYVSRGLIIQVTCCGQQAADSLWPACHPSLHSSLQHQPRWQPLQHQLPTLCRAAGLPSATRFEHPF